MLRTNIVARQYSVCILYTVHFYCVRSVCIDVLSGSIFLTSHCCLQISVIMINVFDKKNNGM